MPGLTGRRHHAVVGTPAAQQGVSLIEVLISVLILGIGMLGIAAMQATALRNSQSSLYQSQAVIQTYAILDAMRVNRAAALNGDYNLDLTCSTPPSTGSLAENDKNRWIASLQDRQSGLGGSACGQIQCAAGECTVTVQWDDSRASDAGNAAVVSGASNRQVVTVTRI